MARQSCADSPIHDTIPSLLWHHLLFLKTVGQYICTCHLRERLHPLSVLIPAISWYRSSKKPENGCCVVLRTPVYSNNDDRRSATQLYAAPPLVAQTQLVCHPLGYRNGKSLLPTFHGDVLFFAPTCSTFGPCLVVVNLLGSTKTTVYARTISSTQSQHCVIVVVNFSDESHVITASRATCHVESTISNTTLYFEFPFE